MGDPPTDLVARLRPHVRHRFDGAEAGWWSPPPPRRRRPRAAAERIGQLTQVIERLALLLDLGDALPAAVRQVADVGRGRVAFELRAVADALSCGQAPADAFHEWARRVGCRHIGELAADLRGCASSDALAVALWRSAATLRRAAHERRMRVLRWRVGVLWVLAAVVCVTSVTLALP